MGYSSLSSRRLSSGGPRVSRFPPDSSVNSDSVIDKTRRALCDEWRTVWQRCTRGPACRNSPPITQRSPSTSPARLTVPSPARLTILYCTRTGTLYYYHIFGCVDELSGPSQPIGFKILSISDAKSVDVQPDPKTWV